MNLHEYQAKNLFKKYNIPTTNGKLLTHSSQLDDIFNILGEENLVIKAQVHAGGRGKAGGVVITKTKQEAKETVNKLLGSKLVTYQTTSEGQPVNSLYIEKPCDIEKQLYLAFIIDRSSQRVTIMTSTEGGVEIEEVAKNNPKKIMRNKINPVVGIMPYQCRQIAFDLGLDDHQVNQMIPLLQNMYKMFLENDLSLVEVNPLVITTSGDLVCLDAKVQVDNSALYRQRKLNEIRDETQEDPRELQAEKMQLNYVSLDGNIACMVNGAGLAMATMDLIKSHGGEPANFLDVGGSTNEQRVIEAFRIILSDTKVNGILINIFGGIVRCDIIANGIIAAVEKMNMDIPLVVRLEGTNAKEGLELIRNSGLNIIEEQDLDKATIKIIELTKGN
ncbi:ADP-forming succinate--CoA ligase subunit beta [Malaciobacter mytili]|uniref:Succinate--CoA ligase [ADP-forming] subunit beta n=1 Tax=Malaciobacter mytili LMG 24559 TaxID=1032238 RepID=A0AAX2AID7_9BACT|nr:ADP-forming succinate--CoA ligase subunit beta [Malaciobacter mytili]AXH15897.1 succinyl-CoA synthetase, beta subunit [Malaciobacter mytili LMG 24559]RXI46233.1 ADP-forming succinate--CoA ligase subunit beta [Malaciobacter mytili]RXK15915.1 ADP-forming succinate--CoA ligase subunit beta [Malaciobacter mytili LMG 24559]